MSGGTRDEGLGVSVGVMDGTGSSWVLGVWAGPENILLRFKWVIKFRFSIPDHAMNRHFYALTSLRLPRVDPAWRHPL